ncbi:hypothetical protein ACFV4N_35090 [Actinosynnema sp. NPDC059797]
MTLLLVAGGSHRPWGYPRGNESHLPSPRDRWTTSSEVALALKSCLETCLDPSAADARRVGSGFVADGIALDALLGLAGVGAVFAFVGGWTGYSP